MKEMSYIRSEELSVKDFQVVKLIKAKLRVKEGEWVREREREWVNES